MMHAFSKDKYMYMKSIHFFLGFTALTLTFAPYGKALPGFNFLDSSSKSEKTTVAFFSTLEQKKKLLEKLQADKKTSGKTCS